MGEIGSQAGFSEVKTRLMCSLTSDILFSLLVEINEVVLFMARDNRVFSVGKKIERVSSVGFRHRSFGNSSTISPLRRIIIGGRRLCSISLMYSASLMIGIVEFPVMGQSHATAAWTTGTSGIMPKLSEKGVTLTVISVLYKIVAFLPSTGESE